MAESASRQNPEYSILLRAFPEMLYDSDQDIERYFELRKGGRSREALVIYNYRLKRKYPEESRRIELLRLYRTHDPEYRERLRQASLELAASMALRTRRNILALTMPMEGLNLNDPFQLLKAVEQVAAYLPSDKYEAVNALDAYKRYASLLEFRAELMQKTAEIVREYLFESGRDDEDGNVDFIQRSLQLEERRRASERKRYFDLSKITFSQADLARIELPANVVRKEDQVLAYCYKYWGLVTDPTFERIVLLYSRKHRTHHYDIFRAIKIGRQRKHTDDEILNTISTVLSSRYSYSVSGDVYMQSMWRRLKAGMNVVLQKSQAENFAPLAPKASAATSPRPISGKRQRAPKVGVPSASGEKPTVAAKPTVATKPEVAEKPAVAAKPTVTVKPVVAAKPTVATKPEVAAKPTVAAKPNVATKPEVAEKPAVAAKPTVTVKPLVAVKPTVASKSDVVAKPTVAAKPNLVTKPEVVAKPTVAAKPNLVTKPEVAAKPAVAAKPTVTVKPVVAVKPTVATKPEVAEKPAVAAKTVAQTQDAIEVKPARAPVAKRTDGPGAEKKAEAGKKARPRAKKRGPKTGLGQAASEGGKSISDMVKRISGRSYDPYRELIMDNLRPSIRHYLLGHRSRRHGIFDNSQNMAEDLIYEYIEQNYSNPFLDWENSDSRRQAAELGYAVDGLEEIIEHCYRRI